MGVMRMVGAVDVSWVAPLIPKLKDPVDIDQLSGVRKSLIDLITSWTYANPLVKKDIPLCPFAPCKERFGCVVAIG